MLCYIYVMLYLCYVILCYVILCYVILCYVMLSYIILCYIMLCYVMLFYVILFCYIMLCYVLLYLLYFLNTFILFLNAFAKLRKGTISFVMSVRPSVRMEQLGSHWTNFREIWYLISFRKSVEKIQIWWKSNNNNRYFMGWKPKYVSDHISLNSSSNGKCFQ
jgi:hypothetical protein